MAEVLKKQRKSNFSTEEVEVLVRTVGKNYETLYGEFSKRAINKIARHRAWIDITKQVNLAGLENRTLQEVKNKWKKCQHLYRLENYIGVSEDVVNPSDGNVWEPLTSMEMEDEDSMPLEQRLKTPTTEQEAVLQSQPLSPTKLKVTRQSKHSHSSPKSPTQPPAEEEEVCLKWNSHHSNMQNTFPNLLLREQYVDATLVAEGQTLKCHRVILSSCSPYFEEVLSSISPYQHPVLFMKDVPFWILKSLCDFMYAGEVHILQTRLEELLAIAETLKIKGLAGTSECIEHEMKPEPGKSFKEEGRDEEENGDEEAKKRDSRKKEDRDIKKREERDSRDKKRPQPAPPPEMPVLKSAKLTKAISAPEIPPVLKNSKSPRNASCTRRAIKKIDKAEKINSDFLDPLGLLEPVYEEVTKDPNLTTTLAKSKDIKTNPLRRSLPKKLKKRKIVEDREESPPPVLSRKGTRSRPNRKVPKFYHSNYDQSTIVREPHTDQSDLFMNFQQIKSEPLDLEDNTIEIEDNQVGFNESDITLEGEEIMGHYDSPIVNFHSEDKEIVLSQPIIMNVESMAGKSDEVDPRGGVEGKSIDPLEDPLNVNPDSSEAHVSTVQNVIESNENSLGFHISQVTSEKEDSREMGFQITNVVSEKDDKQISDVTGEQATNIDLENVDTSKVCPSGIDKPQIDSENIDSSLILAENYVDKTDEDDIAEHEANESSWNQDQEGTISNSFGRLQLNEYAASSKFSEDKTQSKEIVDALDEDNITVERPTDKSSNNNVVSEGTTSASLIVEGTVACISSVTLTAEETVECRTTNVTDTAEKTVDCRQAEETNECRSTSLIAEESIGCATSTSTADETNECRSTTSIAEESIGCASSTSTADETNECRSTTLIAEESVACASSTSTAEETKKCRSTSLIADESVASRSSTSTAEETVDCRSTSLSAEETVDCRSTTLTDNCTTAMTVEETVDCRLASPTTIVPTDSSCHSENDNEQNAIQNELSESEIESPCDRSPDSVGFHIAQVVSEQIAQNEEGKIINQCGTDPDVDEDDYEGRYLSNSNDLETIVNDLSKIVGQSCDEPNSRINEESAESLENIMQD